MQYYHTISPPVSSLRTVEAYFQCVCHSSITEAFSFTKSRHPPARRHLFEGLISFSLGSSDGKQRSDRSMELIGLPFDKEEQSWFESYLLEGKGRALFGAKDTVIVRYLAIGKEGEAYELSRQVKERKIDNMNWSSLTRGTYVT